MASVVLVDNRPLREQRSLGQGWGTGAVTGSTRCSPRLSKLFWDKGRTRNNTDRKLASKNCLCRQQAWSFHHGEALRGFLTPSLQRWSQTTELKAKRWKPDVSQVWEHLNLMFACSCIYLNVKTAASFCIFPFFCCKLQNMLGKADRGGPGQNPARYKEGEDVRAKAVRRDYLPCW